MRCMQAFTGCCFCFSPTGNDAVPEAAVTGRLQFDLQRFAGEKTEEATPKRKEEARSKGQVAKSNDVNAAFIILAAFGVLNFWGSYMYQELTALMRSIFTGIPQQQFTVPEIQHLFFAVGLIFFKVALPVMVAILAVSLVMNYLQVGFVFSLEPLLPDFGKINPITGFGRLFSKRSLVELAKAIVKLVIVCYFVYRFIDRSIGQIPSLMGTDLNAGLKMAAGLVADLVFQISAVMIILAGLDYLYQNWEYQQNLMMSKEEVKQEYKQTEGDPHIKGKIKERQRAMAMRRMMQEVPKASVVVTNPTHYAVALRYDKTMAAPAVVAKGQDFIAQKIKDIAKEHRVAVVENKPLARALYAAVEVGDAVPASLYKAVAEVLAYVYRLKNRLS